VQDPQQVTAAAVRAATIRRCGNTSITVFLALALLFGAQSALALTPKNVLVLYSNSRLVPANVAIDRALNAVLNASDPPVQTHTEFLDHPEFNGDAYDDLMVAYLRGKYAALPPGVIVAVSDDALSFVVQHRAQLFPTAPVIHVAVSTPVLHSITPMPDDIVGVPNDYDYFGTILQALRWHPSARRLVVISGASSRDHVIEARIRGEVPNVLRGVTVAYWSGFPVKLLQARLAALGLDTVVFTAGFYQDGAGGEYTPRDAAALIARVSAAPVYGPYDTFIGTGVVGGRMPSYDEMGAQAGQIVEAIFAGTALDALRLPKETPSQLHIDWRQAQRWGINAQMLPAGTVVHFKRPSIWEMYRAEAMIAAAVIALQLALIAALVVERRRRSVAESTTQNLNAQLAHASRLAVAGELTAAIAHEINQPLGSVQTSADAADLLLQSGTESREDLIRIVTRIRGDTLRASEVIRRLRKLLARHEPEQRPFDVSAAMADVALILRPEAERRKVTLETLTPGTAMYVAGDQTQIQQVFINLILNAMDAVADVSEDRRLIQVLVESHASMVCITVQDRGSGIAPEDIPKVFESFFSTKQRGMGLGLSIARSIVEAHHGRIWTEHREGGGTAFHIELPAPSIGGGPQGEP
jgi:signal transduction histidine kinase